MKLLSLTLIATLGFIACGKKSSSKDGSNGTPSTESLTGGSQVMGAINSALSSVPGESLLTKSSSKTFARSYLVPSNATKHSGNPHCTQDGSPLKGTHGKAKGASVNDNDRLLPNDPNYSATLFVCLATLSPEDGASVDTLPGSLAQVQSILCSLENALGAFEYTAAGNNLTANGPVTVSLSEACWPQGRPDDAPEQIPMDTVVAKELPESSGYQKEIHFAASGMVDYTLRYFNKDGIIGFKVLEPGTAPAVGGYSEVVLDSNTGTIVVNKVDDRGGAGGADSVYRRVLRGKIKGTIGADLKFTGLTSMQGIQAQSAQNLEDFMGVTINGDTVKGYYGQISSYLGGNFTESSKGCTGVMTECSSTGLLFTPSNKGFYSSRTEWAQHRASGLPPCDNGSEITFAAVPTTGAFGKCAP